MSNSKTLSSEDLAILKRMAKTIKRTRKISHHEALDLLAKVFGFNTWSHLMDQSSKSSVKEFPYESFEEFCLASFLPEPPPEYYEQFYDDEPEESYEEEDLTEMHHMAYSSYEEYVVDTFGDEYPPEYYESMEPQLKEYEEEGYFSEWDKFCVECALLWTGPDLFNEISKYEVTIDGRLLKIDFQTFNENMQFFKERESCLYDLFYAISRYSNIDYNPSALSLSSWLTKSNVGLNGKIPLDIFGCPITLAAANKTIDAYDEVQSLKQIRHLVENIHLVPANKKHLFATFDSAIANRVEVEKAIWEIVGDKLDSLISQHREGTD